MNTEWRPCYDCKVRLDRLDRTRQTYTSSLALIEVVSEEEHTEAKSRSTVTRPWCTQCQLQWPRVETQSVEARATTAYQSEFTPNPTEAQELSIQAWLQGQG